MNCPTSHFPEEETEAQRGAVAHTGPGETPAALQWPSVSGSSCLRLFLPACPGGGVRPSRLGEPLGSSRGRGYSPECQEGSSESWRAMAGQVSAPPLRWHQTEQLMTNEDRLAGWHSRALLPRLDSIIGYNYL